MRDIPIDYRTFTHGDLDPEAKGCPVRGCTATLSKAPIGKKGKFLPWCPEHGIRIHGKPGGARTFVYLNPRGTAKESAIRNFPVEQEFLKRHPLRDLTKAETYRFGYENSEDAVTWNVFAGLLAAGALGRAASALTGLNIENEPELWLWGQRVDLMRGFCPVFPPLLRVRERLEGDIRYFATEPDVMLIIPRKLTVLIETKFTSGNSLAVEKTTKNFEKPKDMKGLLERYLPKGTDAGAVVRSNARYPFHGQIFRNIVFAQAMARDPELLGADWAVVNLVSETQWEKASGLVDGKRGRKKGTASYEDPTTAIRSWLREEDQLRFRFSSWEKLHAAVIKGVVELAAVDTYLRGKSAHLSPAFNLL